MNETTAYRIPERFFAASLAEADPELAASIGQELGRQQDGIELIASENIVSRAVLEAQGSVLTNKYAEGYPGRRYYGGCEYVDVAETLAIERAKQLFGCGFANVQPHSRRPGQPGGVPGAAAAGRHLHGPRPRRRRPPDPRLDAPTCRASGSSRCPIRCGARTSGSTWPRSARIALENKPKLIIAGGSAYARIIDFAALPRDRRRGRRLVHGGHGPLRRPGRRRRASRRPFPHAHVVTTTTHKTLRGPRGGMILTNDEDLAKKINRAVFPGLQGGPLMHVIAAKAVAFGEALKPEFKAYARAVVRERHGAGRGAEGAGPRHRHRRHRQPPDAGRPAAEEASPARRPRTRSNRAHMTCNKNAIPFDPEPPMVTSGVRLGTPAGTTRGFGEAEFREVGKLIGEVLDGLAGPTTPQPIPRWRRA